MKESSTNEIKKRFINKPTQSQSPQSQSQSQSQSQTITSNKVNNLQKIPSKILIKLITFSFGLLGLPILTYFFTLERWFSDKPEYAAGLAVVIANVVVIAYVIAAILEDNDESQSLQKEKKKE